MPAHGVPVLDGLPQPVAVHLDPLALEQHQILVAVEQRLQLAGRQRLAAQGDVHVEVHHRAGADERRLRAADRDADLRARSFAPPVRQPHRQAALLERRHAAQKLIGAVRRPRQRPVYVARVHQRLHPVACLSRLLYRRQQRDERRAVPRARVLFQRPAQRQILHPSRRAEAGGIGGHERERPVGIALVLGQVEADPTHLVPARRPRAQQRGQSAQGRGRRAHPLVKMGPDALQVVQGEILAAVHRRGGQNPAGAVGWRRRHDLNRQRLLGQMAQRCQIALGDLLPVAHSGRFARVNPVRRQREERFAPVGVENGLQARQDGRDGVAVAGRPAKLSGRRQSEAHAARCATAAMRSRMGEIMILTIITNSVCLRRREQQPFQRRHLLVDRAEFRFPAWLMRRGS